MQPNSISLSLSPTVLESAMPFSRDGGWAAESVCRITNAAATTGPAKGPRPASSTPMTKCAEDNDRLELRARSSRVRGNEGGRAVHEVEAVPAMIWGNSVGCRSTTRLLIQWIAVSTGVFCFFTVMLMAATAARLQLVADVRDLQTMQSRCKSQRCNGCPQRD